MVTWASSLFSEKQTSTLLEVVSSSERAYSLVVTRVSVTPYVLCLTPRRSKFPWFNGICAFSGRRRSRRQMLMYCIIDSQKIHIHTVQSKIIVSSTTTHKNSPTLKWQDDERNSIFFSFLWLRNSFYANQKSSLRHYRKLQRAASTPT
jgi:hypothetical protein